MGEELNNSDDVKMDENDKEKEELEKFLNDWQKRLQIKQEVCNENLIVTKNRLEQNTMEAPNQDYVNISKLDSSLKRNTAFIKRLRNYTGSQLDVFLKDMSGLNLSKYLSEVASALVDVKLKINDVPSAVQLCSHLHRIYPEFSSILQENWTKTLHLKKNEQIENVSKLRVDLRFYADLISSGVFSHKDSLPLLGTVLTTLTNKDKENHLNVNIIISFCKYCGEDFAGLVPKKIRLLCEKHEKEILKSTLLSAEKQQNVRSLFNDYYISLSQHLVRDHAKIISFERQNDTILRLKGEIRPERITELETMKNDFQTLLNSAETLAELLDQPLPPLQNIAALSGEAGTSESEDKSVIDESLWEDEDTRCFYQVFPNLLEYLPVPNKTQEVATTMTEDKLDEEIKEEDLEVEDANKAEEIINEEPEETGGSASKVALETFLNNLSNCSNRERIDNAAAEFVIFLNTKTARKKLVRALFTVARTRLDLLPFYGRLVAILNPPVPEIATNLITLLKQDFKFHIKKKDQITLESKIKVSRYIGELVKFGLFPILEVLYCFKLLLHDFSHHHIEMACNILETCGRYLYRHPDSRRRTKIYLDDMMRLKSVTAMDIRYTNMIENAYYFINPPESIVIIHKKRPALHEYIRKLVFHDLMSVENERKVLKQLRLLDWNDTDVSDYAVKCLSSVWKIKFHRIPALANLIAGLVDYQDFVGSKVVDFAVEDIRLGMEMNLPKMNQRRVAMVKFFGELYNHRLIDSLDVFKMLYSLITFGVSLNHAIPSPLDPPDNLIRVRLVCTLLDTCGSFFTHSDVKTKLPCFIVYFQCYFWSKKSSPIWTEDNRFPVYATYQLQDCIEKNCPNAEVFKNFPEALNAVKKLKQKIITDYNIIQKLQLAQQSKVSEETNKDDTIYEEDEDENMDEDDERKDEIDDDNEDEDEEEDEEEEDNTDEQTKENTPPLGYRKDIPYNDDDEEFMQALDKMFQDNVHDRHSIRQTQEITIPMLSKARKQRNDAFVLLIRKGNKTQCKNLDVPEDSDLVKYLKNQEEAERQEMEKMKKLTLHIQRLQVEDAAEQHQENVSSVNHQKKVRFNSTQKVDRFLDFCSSNNYYNNSNNNTK